MKFDIIFGHYINYVQGVNSVTNMFLHGKKLLQENGVQLNSIYHPAGVFDCVKNDDLYTSADGTEDARYAYNTSNWKKNISKFAMKSAIGQALHYYVRNVIPAKKTIDRIL